MEQLEKLRATGLEVPDVLRSQWEAKPSTLQGGAVREGLAWEFSLGTAEPVYRLFVNILSFEAGPDEEAKRARLIEALELVFDAVADRHRG